MELATPGDPALCTALPLRVQALCAPEELVRAGLGELGEPLAPPSGHVRAWPRAAVHGGPYAVHQVEERRAECQANSAGDGARDLQSSVLDDLSTVPAQGLAEPVVLQG